MFVKFLLLFTIVPVVELYILIKAGQEIGTMNTVALIILTGIVGASFAKSQGARVIFKIRATLAEGQIPGNELLEGAMIMAGGILLLTPGFLTDFLGFSLLFPVTRQYYVDIARAYIKKKFASGQWQVNVNAYSNFENADFIDTDHTTIDDDGQDSN